MREAVELAAADDVESAAEVCQAFKDCQIAVGLYGEAQRVRNAPESTIQFVVGIRDGGAAVQIGWRTVGIRRIAQPDIFAVQLVAAPVIRFVSGFPSEVRSEFHGIDDGPGYLARR